MANYKQKVMLYDFNGALEAIKAAKVSEPQLKEAQAAGLRKAQWLVDWKNKLIEDLNKKHFTGVIGDTNGTQYTGIDSATPQNLGLKIPYGSGLVPWTKLTSKTLLSVSASFIQPNAPDAADRQWLCAVFAAETGQTEQARSLAESAARSKPEYRDQMRTLLPDSTATH